LGERTLGVINAESVDLDAFSEADERLLLTLAGQLAPAIDRLRQYHAEREQRVLAESLSYTAEVINSSLDFSDVFDRVLTIVASVVPYDTASIIRVENKSGHVIKHQGYEERGLKHWIENLEFNVETTPTLKILLDASEPLLISDVTQDERWTKIIENEWVGSFIACPIRRNGDFFGFINLDHSEKGFYTDKYLKPLQAFANQVAIALENAQLYEDTLRTANRRAALHEVSQEVVTASSQGVDEIYRSIYLAATKMMRADAFALSLLEEDKQQVNLVYAYDYDQFIPSQKIPAGRGLSWMVISSNKSIRIEDMKNSQGLDVVKFSQGDHVRSILAVPIAYQGEAIGMLSVQSDHPVEYSKTDQKLLEMLAAHAAAAIVNARLFKDLRSSHRQLASAYDATLEGWAKALELRDLETEGHSRRVTALALQLAQMFDFSDEQLNNLRRGALLHDVGKMGVPDKILQKPGPLTENEWKIMRKHPLYAFDMLQPIEYLKPSLCIPHYHHEKFDGTGYPYGLKGEQIPLPARIFAIIDVWDALNSDRPYRKAWSKEKALNYIRNQAGKHFDPVVVEKFLLLLESPQASV
jgi:HD-GYP domain-containing protein (c-di-GMP phosphodiesterase class II)